MPVIRQEREEVNPGTVNFLQISGGPVELVEDLAGRGTGGEGEGDEAAQTGEAGDNDEHAQVAHSG